MILFLAILFCFFLVETSFWRGALNPALLTARHWIDPMLIPHIFPLFLCPFLPGDNITTLTFLRFLLRCGPLFYCLFVHICVSISQRQWHWLVWLECNQLSALCSLYPQFLKKKHKTRYQTIWLLTLFPCLPSLIIEVCSLRYYAVISVFIQVRLSILIYFYLNSIGIFLILCLYYIIYNCWLDNLAKSVSLLKYWLPNKEAIYSSWFVGVN